MASSRICSMAHLAARERRGSAGRERAGLAVVENLGGLVTFLFGAGIQRRGAAAARGRPLVGPTRHVLN